MNHTRTISILVCILLLWLSSCNQQRDLQSNTKKYSPQHDTAPVVKAVFTRQSSADMVDWRVVIHDSLSSGIVTNSVDPYATSPMIMTFRGSQQRDMPYYGTLDSVPTKIDINWVYATNSGTEIERSGSRKLHWYGGAGWTGQPSVVSWNGSRTEIIIGSLDGNVYALDVETGQPSRKPFDTQNPIKGSVACDPSMPGIVYVGQGIRHTDRSGVRAVNMVNNSLLSFHSSDDKHAYRRWGYADGSAIVVDSFLFWPAENGIVYKYLRTTSGLRLHSKLIYRVRGNPHLGIESSMAVYSTYGFITDNGGSIICIDLSTLEPLWYRSSGDDTDASPVVCIEDNTPYIYVGSEVDKQGDSGVAFIYKIDASTGRSIWKDSVPCWSYSDSLHVLNGGMLSTPLIGGGKQSNLIITAFCRTRRNSDAGMLIAYDRATGRRVYTTPMHAYTWSSAIAYYTPDKHMYICIGDVYGYINVIDGENGTILIRQRIGSNFEASPVPLGSSFIIASRGRNIYRCSLR